MRLPLFSGRTSTASFRSMPTRMTPGPAPLSSSAPRRRGAEAASESAQYFEHVGRYAGFEPKQFAFNLLTRSRRITYVNLTQRDPEFVREVEACFAAAASGSPDGRLRLSPPPMFVSYRLPKLALANRVAVACGPDLAAGALSGAGLLISEFVSVTQD